MIAVREVVEHHDLTTVRAANRHRVSSPTAIEAGVTGVPSVHARLPGDCRRVLTRTGMLVGTPP